MTRDNLSLDERLDLLAKYPAAVKAAIIDSEDRLVDVLGTVHSVQAQIQKLKLDASTELDYSDTGRRWQADQDGKNQRTYNTQSLLAKLSDGGALGTTLRWLMHLGVISIKWNWEPLQKLIRDRDDINFVKHDIDDGDPEHDIGEWWKYGRHTYTPVEEDTDANKPAS